ncbi:MAG: alkaline phosphatase family protein [Candidatus Eisenbacteria bacterium]|nr:alkaline phosphatase family protein [Candidatus Eisenbacteria bacterium]
MARRRFADRRRIRFGTWFAGGLLAVAALLGGISCARNQAPKVLVIGLDGATWEVLEPWIEAGELPNLKALRDRSAWGTLNSIIPCLSPPAWTTAVTGVNPGRHGIFDFQTRIPGGKVVTETANSRRVAPIWMWLKDKGPRCAIVNVPMTAPPDELNGVMISGLPHVPASSFAYPREFQEQLEAEGYREYLDKMEMKIPEGEEQGVFDHLMATLKMRGEMVKRLYAEKKYDFFWVVFTETDRVQHMFWKYDDPESPNYKPEAAARFGGSIKKLWLEQDRVLGELLAMVTPDTWVLVVSDHGFGPMHHEFRMGNYLRAAESGFTAPEVAEVFGLDRWDASRLYIRKAGADPGDLFLSEEGRRALQAKLIGASLRATDPETGQKPVQHAWRDDEVYVGGMVEKAPYVSYLANRGWFITQGDIDTGYKLPAYGDVTSTLSGWHLMNGIYMLAGPASQPGKNPKVYSLFDIVPTCLYLLRQPIPQDAEGKVMEKALAPQLLQKVKQVREGLLDEENREQSPEEREKLGNLPYMSG